MKCPYCDKDMEMGYIRSDELVQWIPADKKSPRPLLRSSKARNGVVLNNVEDGILYTTYRAEAYYCRVCEIVLAKTTE